MKLIEIIKGRWDTAYIFKDKDRNHWYIITECEGFILNRMFSFEEAKANALKYIGGYKNESAEDIARQKIREDFEESIGNGWIYG